MQSSNPPESGPPESGPPESGPPENSQAAPDALGIERRALALFEQIADEPVDPQLREALFAAEHPAVLARLAALEASAARAEAAMPTLIPGSADCGGISPPPEQVGAFRLVARIGSGGMGDVWLAERNDGLYEQNVAIKFIQSHAITRAAEAFDDERRFLARLDHPAIAYLIDGGVTDDGLPWLAMEYCPGQPIDLACAKLPVAQRIRLFLVAADAVQHAHGRMIAHADLKPANITVGDSGRVKLLDFGIASLIGKQPRARLGSGPLTREFASPQRLAGEGPSVADDVFALGKTLSCLLAGTTDRELAQIAGKAQHETVAGRYGSVAALIADLERWQAQLPVSAVPDGMRYRARKFVRRHRNGVIATAVALAGLSATSAVATVNYTRAEHERQSADQRFGEVRSLSRFMLFDLYDELSRQPGTVQKRAEIAEKSALYLRNLLSTNPASPGLRLDIARSYRRLAAIQGLPGLSNLGQPEAAARSLDAARTMLDDLLRADPRNAQALAERGWTENDMWTLQGESRDSVATNRRALALFDAALQLSPDDPSAQLGRLTTLKNQAFERIWTEARPAEALAPLQRSLATLRARRWPPALATQAEALEIAMLNRIGDATYYRGDIAGSLQPYREADALTDRAMQRDGEIPQWLILKGENAFNISGSLGDMGGHNGESLAIAEQGIARLHQLLGFGPDAAAEKKLLVLLGQQAALLDTLGRRPAALKASQASIALRRQRIAAAPADPRRMRDLAIGLAAHSRLLTDAGRQPDACAAAREALAIWQRIAARGNLGKHDAESNLPQSRTRAAQACRP